MADKYTFEFSSSPEVKHNTQATFKEAIIMGYKMSINLNKPVQERVYNDALHRWEFAATYYPDGTWENEYTHKRYPIEERYKAHNITEEEMKGSVAN